MMKNRFMTAAMAVLAGLAVVSCDELEDAVDEVIAVNISAVNGEFDQNGEATLTVGLNVVSYKDVIVTLGSKPTEVEQGYTAITDPEALVFDASVTIPASTQSVSVKVKVDPELVEAGQEAVITIVHAEGASIGSNSTVYIKVPGNGYGENGNGNGNDNDDNKTTGTLEWTLKYNGAEWLEGYYSDGQLECFEVSNTDVTKYYYPIVWDTAEGDLEAQVKADSDAFFADLQEELEGTIALYEAFFGVTREELIPYLFYNESVDGTEVFMQGLPAGKYQFMVASADMDGYFDKNYAILSFEKTEDAIAVYDWNINVSVNPEWTAEWDGWEPGDEGEYFWMVGNAPGAAYVYVEAYTDEEMEEYFENGVQEMINGFQSTIKDGLYLGDTLEELLEDYFVPVDEDGYFEALLCTWGVVGETNVYIVGVDANGNMLGGYGVSPIEIPEYEPEPIDFVERTDWAVAYDETVDTEDPDYPYAVVTTVCDAEYYVVEVYPEGYWDGYELDDICEDAMYYVDNYGLSTCLQAGVAFDSVPGVYSVHKLKNGYEAYIFGVDVTGKPTGEWHMDVITGVTEIPAADWKERTDWAINYDASVDTEDETYNQAVVVTACDAPYFVTTIWDAGALEESGLNEISDDALYYVDTYGMETCLKYDVVHTSVPSVEAWKGLENGMEAYIFAIDENGALTGEWHMETLTGIGGSASAPSVRKASVVNAPKLATAKKEIKGKTLRTTVKADSASKSYKASLKENKPSLKKVVK